MEYTYVRYGREIFALWIEEGEAYMGVTIYISKQGARERIRAIMKNWIETGNTRTRTTKYGEKFGVGFSIPPGEEDPVRSMIYSICVID